jgi:geranylgeranyl pyrophosphate synthase
MPGLESVITYALGGEGKRLRPALTMMVAEGLGVEKEYIRPLLAAIEVFHSASLVFDDLPAQDDAVLRRGRPVTHLAYPEGDAQVAGVSMIAQSFAMLGRLHEHFPADRVVRVIDYVGRVLGGQLCEGQHLDLVMERASDSVPGEQIIKMYSLKTSSLLEAASVPLLMLSGRPESEIAHMRGFAEHAGIVYQIRDDIIDATARQEDAGKDTGSDEDKINLVRSFGLQEADRRLSWHAVQAVDHCRQLPFDTRLLQGILQHFAERRR